jgi:RloB-like protein
MPEAWELIPEKERTADAITTFILFCEDKVNEPAYFRSFEKPGKVKVNPVEGQLSSFKNIIKTLQYCEKEGLLEINNNHYQLKAGTTKHIWSVFDRDSNTSPQLCL